MVFRSNIPDGQNRVVPAMDALLSSYRQALPETDASPEFMPMLWARIEQRQRTSHGFRRMASGFVTAAAAICLMLTVALWAPPTPGQTQPMSAYIDVLADDKADADLTQESL